jgi:signal peptide peptidase SppA
MPHEISRLLRAFGAQAWLIEPRKAAEIVAMLEYRHAHGVRPTAFRDDGPAPRPEVSSSTGRVRVVRLYGVIMPRAEAVEDISQASALMTDFMAAFKSAANDPGVSAIVLDIDSPGGRVDLVQEAGDMVFRARKAGRPIVAVANTCMCSAAYWIGAQADQLVATPSGEVGSIGVYTVHQDISEYLAAQGVAMTYVFEGPRKVEGNPFEPLGPEARAYLQDSVRATYDMFVEAVARGRKVKDSMVRADPESAKAHFGGGRSYGAKTALELGMVDRIESLDQVIARLQQPVGVSGAGRSARVFG